MTLAGADVLARYSLIAWSTKWRGIRSQVGERIDECTSPNIWPQLLLAWSIQAMGILSPGPSVALILGVATSRGRLPSLVTAFGVACGSYRACPVATVAGVTAILAQVAGTE